MCGADVVGGQTTRCEGGFPGTLLPPSDTTGRNKSSPILTLPASPANEPNGS
jgi:hypothetical protein